MLLIWRCSCDWHVDVEIPTPLLKNAASHVGFVRERSNDSVTLIRFTHQLHGCALYPDVLS